MGVCCGEQNTKYTTKIIVSQKSSFINFSFSLVETNAIKLEEKEEKNEVYSISNTLHKDQKKKVGEGLAKEEKNSEDLSKEKVSCEGRRGRSFSEDKTWQRKKKIRKKHKKGKKENEKAEVLKRRSKLGLGDMEEEEEKKEREEREHLPPVKSISAFSPSKIINNQMNEGEEVLFSKQLRKLKLVRPYHTTRSPNTQYHSPPNLDTNSDRLLNQNQNLYK